MIVRAVSMEYMLVFAPKEHPILARPGRAWYEHERESSSERALENYQPVKITRIDVRIIVIISHWLSPPCSLNQSSLDGLPKQLP